jgi:beta-glucosidase
LPTRFPDGFRWGTATSAYQVEGRNTAADWWQWEQVPGRIRDGGRSGLACDWWRHAEHDFDLMAALHQNAVRLSVEWSRCEPEPGRWDEGAVSRYVEMFDGLRRRGIAPLVTLNHFTLPAWVAARGGWLWDGIPAAFAAFASRFVRATAQRVDQWITVNEPVGYLISGHLEGRFPPGRRNPLAFVRALRASIRAHAAAYRAIHEAQAGARVGIAAHLRPVQPANPRSGLDRVLAARLDHTLNWMYLDALTAGRLVAPGLRLRVPEAAGTLDFLGVNYYTRTRVAFDPRRIRSGFIRAHRSYDAEMSDADWGEVYPDGLLAVLRASRRYGLPISITENGLPDADDDLRPRFITEHLLRVAQAVGEGCPVKGYYHWSLVDNFEWADGWSLRFGLYALDPLTQARTPRPSAGLYAEISRRNALP